LEPEIRYSEAKLHMMHTGKEKPDEALALFERVAQDFPRSPFAGRALMDAGTLCEMHGRKEQALSYYRRVTTSYEPSSGCRTARLLSPGDARGAAG
jgi:TolA-binding protein